MDKTYNQTWYIGALWEPSHYDALRGHMTRSKVIGGQIVIVISVNLFQIAPVRTGSLQLQPNLVHRCNGNLLIMSLFEVT